MNKFKKSKLSIDERIENSKFDYCKNLKWFLIAPLVICLVGVILLCTLGFNLGLEFTGGTNMTMFIDKDGTYSEQKYDINNNFKTIEDKINKVLKNHGLEIGTLQKTSMDDDVLPISNGSAVIIKYQNDNSLDEDEIQEVNDNIRLELLKEFGFVEEDVTLEDLADLDNSNLVKNNGLQGPTARAELLMKSFIALLVAVVLILIYVAIRFEITGGLSAILALFHDLIITASVVLIFRIQVNAAFIAALITILGYSINNTIIIFDRMRDELKVAKQSNEKIDNNKIANTAVRSTMMRSILTGVTTLVMVLMITIIGVADIREFAFPIMVGIIAGFYSSVFLTPGLWAIAYRPRKNKKSKNKKQEKPVEVVNA